MPPYASIPALANRSEPQLLRKRGREHDRGRSNPHRQTFDFRVKMAASRWPRWHNVTWSPRCNCSQSEPSTLRGPPVPLSRYATADKWFAAPVRELPLLKWVRNFRSTLGSPEKAFGPGRPCVAMTRLPTRASIGRVAKRWGLLPSWSCLSCKARKLSGFSNFFRTNGTSLTLGTSLLWNAWAPWSSQRLNKQPRPVRRYRIGQPRPLLRTGSPNQRAPLQMGQRTFHFT